MRTKVERGIRQLGPNRYEVRAYVGDDPSTGKPRTVSRVISGGIRAARAKRAELETEASARRLTTSKVTVSQLLEAYFEHLERAGRSPQTLHAYRRYARLHLEPAVGKVPLVKLTSHQLDRIYAGMQDGGKHEATVRHAHAVISGALGQAVKWGWVDRNVAKLASPPSVRHARIVTPTPDQVQQIIAEAQRSDPVMGRLLLLAAITGCRRGELCALRWSDVDLEHGTMNVERSILDMPGRQEEKSTKSHQGRRLALGAAGAKLLREHHEDMVTIAAQASVRLAPDGFVFTLSPDGKEFIRPDKVTGFFRRLIARHPEWAGITVHSLRHFTATQLAASGTVSVRTIAGRLGHADPSITLRVYSAWLPPEDQQAADMLGDLLT